MFSHLDHTDHNFLTAAALATVGTALGLALCGWFVGGVIFITGLILFVDR